MHQQKGQPEGWPFCCRSVLLTSFLRRGRQPGQRLQRAWQHLPERQRQPERQRGQHRQRAWRRQPEQRCQPGQQQERGPGPGRQRVPGRGPGRVPACRRRPESEQSGKRGGGRSSWCMSFGLVKTFVESTRECYTGFRIKQKSQFLGGGTPSLTQLCAQPRAASRCVAAAGESASPSSNDSPRIASRSQGGGSSSCRST